MLGEFVDAIAAAEHVLAYSKRFGKLDDIRANIFDLLAVFCFNSDKAIGDQATQVKGNLRAIAIRHWHRRAILPRPVYFARFFECGE